MRIGEDCPICLDSFEDGQKVLVHESGKEHEKIYHVFHAACEDAKRPFMECPLDREPLVHGFLKGTAVKIDNEVCVDLDREHPVVRKPETMYGSLSGAQKGKFFFIAAGSSLALTAFGLTYAIAQTPFQNITRTQKLLRVIAYIAALALWPITALANILIAYQIVNRVPVDDLKDKMMHGNDMVFIMNHVIFKPFESVMTGLPDRFSQINPK